MKPNKKQRREIYLEAINLIPANEFICKVLDKLILNSQYEFYFPEFMLFKPLEEEKEFEGAGWFSESLMNSPKYTDDKRKGNKRREIVLLLCAEMTK